MFRFHILIFFRSAFTKIYRTDIRYIQLSYFSSFILLIFLKRLVIYQQEINLSFLRDFMFCK